jgi:hypothetical protein
MITIYDCNLNEVGEAYAAHPKIRAGDNRRNAGYASRLTDR